MWERLTRTRRTGELGLRSSRVFLSVKEGAKAAGQGGWRLQATCTFSGGIRSRAEVVARFEKVVQKAPKKVWFPKPIC